MYLIVGLGNPGKKFEKTRHNFGFMAIDELIQAWQANPLWAEELYVKENYDSLFSEWEVFWGEVKHAKEPGKNIEPDHQHVVLAQPHTMMNNSGLAVKKLVRAFKLAKEIKSRVVVIHDDIDLPVGSLKISFGASAAGHKGVQSIIDQLNTKDFIRLRLGIRPAVVNSKISTEKFVLEKFTTSESKLTEQALNQVPVVIKVLLLDGVSKAMSLYNKKV